MDQVQPSTNQYRRILTQFLQVPTSSALYWPSATKYQPVFERISTCRSFLNLSSCQFTSGVEFDQGYLSFLYHQKDFFLNFLLYFFCLFLRVWWLVAIMPWFSWGRTVVWGRLLVVTLLGNLITAAALHYCNTDHQNNSTKPMNIMKIYKQRQHSTTQLKLKFTLLVIWSRQLLYTLAAYRALL